jgi:hypothetical protein
MKDFRLNKPCADCPFLKEGAIYLSPGRLEGIIQTLLANDACVFFCHTARKKKAYCLGAMVYLDKCGRPNVPMRIGWACKELPQGRLERNKDRIIDP